MGSTSRSEPDIEKTLEIDPASGRSRRLKRWLVAAIIVAVAAVAVFLWRNTRTSDAMKYETSEAARGDLTIIATATGTLQPTNEVEVGSEISGIIKTVEADYNDKVEPGQVLARLDTSKLSAQEKQLKAALESAKAKVLQVKATVNETRSKLAQVQRVRELSGGKVPSQAELDTAQAAFDRAEADEASATAAVSQAEAALDATQTDLKKSVIVSPIRGVVLARSVEPGQTVAAAFQAPVLFTLAEDLAQMELHVDVDEADIGKVKEGQDATFQVDAYPDRTFKGKITQVRFGSKTVDGVVTYETVLDVDNSDLSLRPGMTATAEITVQRIEGAVLVPSAALRFSPPAEATEQPSRGLL
ncbi:MAG: efflux RND transporter periplasmic adaptor subunit, partial [Planctomycetes bacterium]|nr:efflux RND transporter periplasmic adaptor subunit [Planctomycetota bacterium]